MKITFVCGNWTHFSGGNRVISLYAQKLQQRGHDVFEACSSRQKPSIKQLRLTLKQQVILGTIQLIDLREHYIKLLNVPIPVGNSPPVQSKRFKNQ